MNRKNALGRGLGALIPSYGEEKVDNPSENFTERKKLSTNTEEKVDNPVDNSNKVLQLPLSKVEPREKQPRMVFDEGSLSELAESIKQHGVLQPILVCEKGDHYEIVAGERRWRAAKMAGLLKIPALVGTYEERQINELALIENIQREDLNPIEEALAYQRLVKEFSLKQEEVAAKVSKDRSTVTNALRLLKLDERVQEMVSEGKLSSGVFRVPCF